MQSSFQFHHISAKYSSSKFLTREAFDFYNIRWLLKNKLELMMNAATCLCMNYCQIHTHRIVNWNRMRDVSLSALKNVSWWSNAWNVIAAIFWFTSNCTVISSRQTHYYSPQDVTPGKYFHHIYIYLKNVIIRKLFRIANILQFFSGIDIEVET